MRQNPGKIDLHEGIIRPGKKSTDPELGPDVLMALISKDLEYLVRLGRARKIAHSGQGLFRLYQTRNEGERANLSGPFLGAPLAAMGMEKLIAMGAERVWVLGCCGSLQPDLKIGDLIMPTGALSEEGTSPHYPIGERTPMTDEGLNAILEKALGNRGQDFCKGSVWTTDAPYRETPAKVRAFQEQGVLAVEMEMSALMTVGIYRGVRVSGLLVVSDELFDLKWRPGFSSDRFRRKSRLAAEVLIHAMTSFPGESHHEEHEGHEENNGIR